MKKYTKEHEWVDLDGGVATVGITDHAQDELGDIVFVELPGEGDEVNEGEDFVVIESVKAVASVYAPMAGTVTEVNTELEEEPQLINSSAEGTWIAKLQVSDATPFESLMDAAAYAKFLEEEG